MPYSRGLKECHKNNSSKVSMIQPVCQAICAFDRLASHDQFEGKELVYAPTRDAQTHLGAC